MPASIVEYALRVCESIAFTLHGILGVTEPFTGCLRSAFQDKGVMPSWFWPTAGLILWAVAYLNLSLGHVDGAVLVIQSYIASFHTGAVFYHLKLGHEPAVAVAPYTFAVFAFVVISIRFNVLVAIVTTVISTFIAYGLSLALLGRSPPGSIQEQDGAGARLVTN
ncbi:hypothetical protein ACHAXR_009591 [Thalassiosira sp. AJA248-18]